MASPPPKTPPWALNLFDRYCQLEMEARVRWIDQGERTRIDVQAESTRLADFRNRRVQDPRFGRYYNVKVLGSRVAQKHLHVLTDLLVRSVAAGGPIELADLFQASQRDPEILDDEPGASEFHDYGPRRFQQFRNEVYSSFVYDDPVGSRNDNTKPFFTVAKPGPLPKTPSTPEADYHLWADAQESKQHPVPIRRYAITMALDGARLQRLNAWEQALRRVAGPWIKQLRGNGPISADLHALLEDAMTRGTIFNHLESIVVSEWFRGRPVDQQVKILASQVPVTLSAADVASTLAEMRRQSWALDVRLEALFDMLTAWLRLGYPEEAEVVARGLLAEAPTHHQVRSPALDSLALALLDQGKAAEACAVWRDLVDAWSREGDHYQRLVAIKNLARAQLAQGNQSSYLEAVDAYVEGARSLPSKQRFGAALNLAGLFAQAGDVRRSLVAVSDAASHAEIDELELTTYLLAWLGERRQGQSVSPVDWRAALQRFADVRDRHR